MSRISKGARRVNSRRHQDQTIRRLRKELEQSKSAEARLMHERDAAVNDSLTDETTRVPNRKAGTRIAEALHSLVVRQGGQYALAMVDIDHFKAVNDTFGHPAGDEALKQVAARLMACTRKSDGVFRWGGEEFLVVLPHTEGEGAKRLLERFREAVMEPVVLVDPKKGIFRTITVSIGYAVYCEGDSSFVTVEARADAALYRAKEGGRNRVEFAE